MASLDIKGFDKFIKKVGNIERARRLLDPAFSASARESTRMLILKTSKKTGTTARGWQTPAKLKDSSYVVTNEINTSDGKHSIIRILDQGHGLIRPKKDYLYIPLSNKGSSKRLGGPIPKDFVRGVDYILAKSVKPVKGLNFIDPILNNAARQIEREVSRIIAGVFDGK